MIALGIDPGTTGGVAALAPSGALIFAMRTPHSQAEGYDLQKMLDALRELQRLGAGVCALEVARPFTSLARTAGTPKTYMAQARGRALWEMALAAAAIRCVPLEPARWHRQIPLPRGDKKLAKRLAVSKAIERWPLAEKVIGRARAESGVADALWIAEWMRRELAVMPATG